MATPVMLRPMLAESIDPKKLPTYAADPAWAFEQKVDGHRLLVIVSDGQVKPMNRAGEPRANALSRRITADFERIQDGPWAFDGELVGEVLWLFDLPIALDRVSPEHPYRFRRQTLSLFFEGWKPNDKIRLLPTRWDEVGKLELAQTLVKNRAEGAMVKHLDAPYASGKRSRHILKAKFTKTVDCVVTRIGVDGKDNIEVGLWNGGPEPKVVGKSSTIGKGTFAEDDVVEIRYLYVVESSGRLYQPTILRKRDDKPGAECTIDQLQYTNKEVIDL